MRLCPSLAHWAGASVVFRLLALVTAAERIIESSALEECQSNSSFTASLFNIVFTPNNNSLALNVVGDSSIAGNVTLQVQAAAYGYTFLTESLDPCTMGLSSLCPLKDIQIAFDTVYSNISSSFISRIPGVAYGVPDLDATVIVHMSDTDNPKVSLACVRSRLSNGHTVYQSGVGWATAIVAGVGLLTSALVSGLGHSNAASHVALYALSLFNYFQAVAIIGLCAVPLPPIVQSWTQDFSWSLGIIRVGFLQMLATWYQIATGGKPATVLNTLSTKSVQVLKRGIEGVGERDTLHRRAQTVNVPSGEYIVKGMKRVAFRAGMESTNLFLTGIIFFCAFMIFILLGVTLFKKLCDLAIRAKWMKSHRFQNFRDNYRVTLKGIIFRILLIGYPQITILCLWEFTQVDSPGEVVLAVIVFLGISAALFLAAFKVIQIARRSERIHKTPAYMLYADTTVLSKWGFLYIQFRASAYYYIIPTLAYILVKGMFVALGQGSGTVQAIALVIIEAMALISASTIRPWMDKPANAINISICVINFANAVFLLIFTGIFNGPGLLVGVVSIIFFVANALFALVLLFIVLIAVGFSFAQKNPEKRYQPVADNRASFIKSQTTLTAELDALGYTARGGESKEEFSREDISFENNERKLQSLDNIYRQRDTIHSNSSSYEHSHSPVSPISPSLPSVRSDLPSAIDLSSSNEKHDRLTGERAGSLSADGDSRNIPQYEGSHSGFQSENNTPWQRGAGYDR